jgi:hypothetical protein
MFKYFTVIFFLVSASVTSGMIAFNPPVENAAAADAFRSDGTYDFYYHGEPMWSWAFSSDAYVGVNFDPMDNEGDTTSGSYDVTYVDSLWDYGYYVPYQVTLYVCADDGGVPDFDNPLYESDAYEPEYYSDWDEHEFSPPIEFNGGEICWVIFAVPEDDGRPISDGDGNSGHSWISGDGYYWELTEYEGGIDWCIEVYAEPGGPPEDDEPPTITDTYPVDEDWPSGVPPGENFAGCHWMDGDPAENRGIDVGASSFFVYLGSDLILGMLDVDDTDLYEHRE